MSYLLDPAFLLSGPVIGLALSYVFMWKKWSVFRKAECSPGQPGCACYDFTQVWKYWLLVIVGTTGVRQLMRAGANALSNRGADG